jgi:methyltransferase-like protein
VLAQGVSETFAMPNGAKQMIFDALTKAALVVMGEQWPRCFAFEELYELSRSRLRAEIGDAPVENDDLKSFGDRMLQGYAAHVIELRVSAPSFAVSISERPVASPLARHQLAHGAKAVTNLRHEPVELPELARRILMLLDGTRDAEAVATDIVKLGRDGTIGVREQEGGPAVTDPARLEALLRALVADHLPKLARVALLLQ